MSNSGLTEKCASPAVHGGETNASWQLDGQKAADSHMCFFQGKPGCCSDRQFGAVSVENAKNQKRLDFFFTKHDKIGA